MDEPIYTTGEVAEKLKVAQKTVREWIGRGELAAIDLGQGYRILQSDLEAFLQAHKRLNQNRGKPHSQPPPRKARLNGRATSREEP